MKVLERVGHGELLILMGFVLALGGAQLFEFVNLKGDLGALIVGALLAGHYRTDEIAKSLFGFKELFLVAFFLNIGMSEMPNLEILACAVLLLLILPLKMLLYFVLFTRFRLRVATATSTTLTLTNYSEFGLIVSAIAVSTGWLTQEWMLIIALALALSFVISALLNTVSSQVHSKLGRMLEKFESTQRLTEDAVLSFGKAHTLVIGMGRVGTAVYDSIVTSDDVVLGIDQDMAVADEHRKANRNVLVGDAADPEFWSRVCGDNEISKVLLVIPEHAVQVSAIEQMSNRGYKGVIAATTKYPDEIDHFRELGVDAAYNVYTEAGSGFADHIGKSLARNL